MLFRKIGSFFARERMYFSMNRDLIAEDNFAALRGLVRVFTAFLVLYGVLTYLMMRSKSLIVCYLIFGGADLAFLLFVTQYGRRGPRTFCTVQIACMLFVLVILLFTTAVSVFPYHDRPGIFYPLGYVLSIMMFFMPFGQMTALLTFASAVYLVLVFAFKSPYAISFDVFGGITTWLLGHYFLYIITSLRLRNGEAMNQLEELNHVDELTGLLNRRGMRDYIIPNFQRIQQQNFSVTVLMMDVDNFKRLNDSFGHLAGDRCLSALGGMLREFSGLHGGEATKYGGEEFVIVLYNCGMETGTVILQLILEKVRSMGIQAPNGTVTASFGAVVRQLTAEDQLEDLIDQADEMMYQAKKAGKNRGCLFNLDTDEQIWIQ